MSVREYIGARYIPLFMGEWNNTVAYEPLSVVVHEGNSYTSRQAVPIGIDITNEIYWALSGNYNAQIEAYRQEVLTFNDRITANTEAIEGNTEAIETNTEAIENINTDVNERIDDITKTKDNIIHIDKVGFSTNINCFYKLFKFKQSLFDFEIIPASTITSIPLWVKNNNPIFAFNGPSGYMYLSQGQVLGNTDGVESQHWYVLAMKQDGKPVVIQDLNEGLTATALKNQGYVFGCRGWSPIILNNVRFDYQNIIPDSQNKTYIFENKHSRTMFCWDDEYYYVLQIEGMIPFSEGANFNEQYALCVELGIKNAFNLDGGGSVQSWISKPIRNFVYQNKEKGQINPNDSRVVTLINVIERN